MNGEEKVMSNKLDEFAKMLFDYTLTAVGTVAISPLLFYIAYRINKEDPGPIFFAHTRIGKDGKPFPCYKFRSMEEPLVKVNIHDMGSIYNGHKSIKKREDGLNKIFEIQKSYYVCLMDYKRMYLN